MYNLIELVLRYAEQLLKIKTVLAIDDHSDGEDARVRQDLKVDSRVSVFVHATGMTGQGA